MAVDLTNIGFAGDDTETAGIVVPNDLPIGFRKLQGVTDSSDLANENAKSMEHDGRMVRVLEAKEEKESDDDVKGGKLNLEEV